MRIALTGAGGFIGQKLRQWLEARSHTVIGSDLCANADIQALDLRKPVAVKRWLASSQPEIVIHAGAISGAMVASDSPDDVTDVNVGGTANILAAMSELGIGEFVFLSSIAVYASRQDRAPVDEASPLASNTAYGRSKIAAEGLIHDAMSEGGLRSCTVLRLSSVYGAGRTTPYLISDLARCAAVGRPAQVTDASCNMRQFLHVDDCVRAIGLALERRSQGFACINVTGASYVSELEIAQMAAKYLPGLSWQVVPRKEPGDGEFGPLDITRAKTLLGYEPQVSLEQGLARTYAAAGNPEVR